MIPDAFSPDYRSCLASFAKAWYLALAWYGTRVFTRLVYMMLGEIASSYADVDWDFGRCRNPTCGACSGNGMVKESALPNMQA